MHIVERRPTKERATVIDCVKAPIPSVGIVCDACDCGAVGDFGLVNLRTICGHATIMVCAACLRAAEREVAENGGKSDG
jgi:hypothetical protein